MNRIHVLIYTYFKNLGHLEEQNLKHLSLILRTHMILHIWGSANFLSEPKGDRDKKIPESQTNLFGKFQALSLSHTK